MTGLHLVQHFNMEFKENFIQLECKNCSQYFGILGHCWRSSVESEQIQFVLPIFVRKMENKE